jgi:hypothetical protein
MTNADAPVAEKNVNAIQVDCDGLHRSSYLLSPAGIIARRRRFAR